MFGVLGVGKCSRNFVKHDAGCIFGYVGYILVEVEFVPDYNRQVAKNFV